MIAPGNVRKRRYNLSMCLRYILFTDPSRVDYPAGHR
ncbi:hypothetical protein P9A48_gp65 [Xanthomonas phage Mallos]|uniref:Uncharacterized protein n=1 Tax=Xanthomonas phage Mallos TaxID=2939131 RepID=A0A9E7E202_9CAUD|nr:hypothetical protein P9A48_gp65 [Xanthomonas phage Mallos]URA07173.1 hypothetical protein Mallos_BL60065 [Xanthomonas phage Mallos]